MMPPDAAARDPYLAWALATGLAGHSALAGRPANGYLPLLLNGPVALAQRYPAWRVPQHYLDRPDSGFWTAWVPAAAVDALTEVATGYAMALPLRDEAIGALHRQPPQPAQATTPVIGVIDNGCACLNRSFSQPGAPDRSRFISLWRQRPTADAGKTWQTPADFGYGLELLGSDLDPGAPDEAAAYASLGYPLDGQGRLSEMLHGTHVLDIAAGLPQGLPAQASAKPAVQDPACEAGLVFVELPQPLAEDSTGAGLDAFIVDAVNYVLSRAGPDRRVIINLSLGAQAGPHDGGSLVEQALDRLIADEGGRLSICVAAGNGAQERWHARGRLQGRNSGREAMAGWRTVPGDTTDSFLELWATARDPAALDGLSVMLTAPDGRVLRARLGDSAPRLPGLPADSPPQAMLDLRAMPVFAGRHRTCALVSLAPTAGPRAGQPAGLWQVAVASPPPPADEPAHGCRLALWLQRDTPGRSLDEVLQSELEGLSPNLGLAGESALSHLAGGSRVVTVGAARLSDSLPSSYSPSDAIDAWGMGDESATIYGLLCSGGLSGSVFRISGTSAATPMVVRALANDAYALSPPVQGKGPAGAGKPPIAPRGAPLVRPDGSQPGSMRPVGK